MNKFFLLSLLFTTSLLLNASNSYADNSDSDTSEIKKCLLKSETKVIDIKNEVVFDTNKDCSSEEIINEYVQLPILINPEEVIVDYAIKDTSVEEILDILKAKKVDGEQTEDLIKLIDFIPTALPASLKLLIYSVQVIEGNEINVLEKNLVLIDSENVKVQEVKSHKVITLFR